MNFDTFISSLNKYKSQEGKNIIKFDNGAEISEENFRAKFKQYYNETLDSLINCEKATKGWKDIFINLSE